MKFVNILPLAALSSAYVISSEQVLGELIVEDHHGHNGIDNWLESAANTKDELVNDVKKHYEDAAEAGQDVWSKIHKCGKQAKNAMDAAFERATDTALSLSESVEESVQDVQSWWQDSDILDSLEGGHRRPGRPGRGRKPHHPPHHKPNETVYQLIAGSKYTTKLAKLISEYDDIVDLLNSTSAGNYTIFAPTDKAFEKIPDKAPKPSKEFLKAVLAYHVIPDFYPAGRVLVSHTAPTLLKIKSLSDHEEPQRIAFKIGLRGLTVNFYSRIVAINIFGTNGVIHGVDSLLVPPPSAITEIDLFPGEFSTLELGLGKTGLLEKLNTTNQGGTLFAPSNFAFQKLGPKINAFLFSKYGVKYLKALLEYHVVPGHTLYSDAYYKPSGEGDSMTVPKGFFHVDLPTLLKDRELSVDVARYGGFISIKINGFATVAVQDGIAENGVIHIVRDVLIPPKQLAGAEEHWSGGELTVEDLKERLEPFVAKTYL